MENISFKWYDYLSLLGILGILGFVNPYFSSLGALAVFHFWNSKDAALRRFSLMGFLAFIGPIVLILSKLK
jgi:hypothetical protein